MSRLPARCAIHRVSPCWFGFQCMVPCHSQNGRRAAFSCISLVLQVQVQPFRLILQGVDCICNQPMHYAALRCTRLGLVDRFFGYAEKIRASELGKCEHSQVGRPRNSRRAAFSCVARPPFAPNRVSSTVWWNSQLSRQPRSSRWHNPGIRSKIRETDQGFAP